MDMFGAILALMTILVPRCRFLLTGRTQVILEGFTLIQQYLISCLRLSRKNKTFFNKQNVLMNSLRRFVYYTFSGLKFDCILLIIKSLLRFVTAGLWSITNLLHP